MRNEDKGGEEERGEGVGVREMKKEREDEEKESKQIGNEEEFSVESTCRVCPIRCALAAACRSL